MAMNTVPDKAVGDTFTEAMWDTYVKDNLNGLPGTFQTTLPGAPTNGQIIVYQNAAMATSGIAWLLRYDSGGGTYKWNFLGGPPLLAEVHTSENTASTTYVDLATAGPTITAPLAGIYVVEHGCHLLVNSAGAVALQSFIFSGSSAIDLDDIRHTSDAASGQAHVSRKLVKTIAAAQAVTTKYRVTAGTGSFLERFIAITPKQVG